MLRRVGYVLAHSAMVLIFLGGLADSEVMLKLRLATGQSVPVKGSVTLDQVPPEARIAASNWSYRGNMLVPEGRSSGVAILNAGDGILIQDLPFSISLKRFQIEHYSTGQPRLFASDVLVTDKDSGQSFEARIEVNKPLIHRGIAVYQSSFDDGGTLLKLSPLNLMGGMRRLSALEGRVGEVLKLDVGDDSWKLELVGFRPFNIENVGDAESADTASIATDTGSMDRLRQGFGSAAPSAAKKDLRNVGPSFQYKLRDAAGQALEYNNYMLPLQLDGRWFLASGVRESPSEPFRFLRLPLDENATLEQYLALRGVMLDSASQREVARRFALGSEGVGGNSTLQSRLEDSAMRVMETFSVRGYQAVAAFLENAVPETERERAAEVYVRILQGVSWEAWMLARERAGLPRLESTPLRGRFVQDALNALSDSFFYGVPLYLQLSSYDEVKASVFQLTRSPGKPVVYGGCLLLVLGIFAMFFIRERRLWLLVRADGSGKLAFASNRKTLDIETEFAAHRAALGNLLASAAAAQPGQ
jgi:cytochrome c biogenesis protein